MSRSAVEETASNPAEGHNGASQGNGADEQTGGDKDLRARLESNNAFFESLMALIPAEEYYGRDYAGEASGVKKTKEEKRAARKAKLDPATPRSALDVHRERERKRKREDEIAQDDTTEGQQSQGQAKKHKLADASDPPEPVLDPAEKIRLKRKEKRDRKKAEKAKLKEKKERRKQRKQGTTDGVASTDLDKMGKSVSQSSAKKVAEDEEPRLGSPDESDSDEENEDERNGGLSNDFDVSALGDVQDDDSGSEQSDSMHDRSPLFDREGQRSSASSSSSVIPPSLSNGNQLDTSKHRTTTDAPTYDAATRSSSSHASKAETKVIDSLTSELNPKSELGSTPHPPAASADSVGTNESSKLKGKLPQIPHDVLRQRIENKIAELRAARKADGPDGKPARSRAELIESRRRKQELRKQQKKEQRVQLRLQQVQEDAAAEAARLRGGSGSPLGSPGSVLDAGGLDAGVRGQKLSFGRLAFDDGDEVDNSTENGLKSTKRVKGPSDARTALEAATNKQKRLSGLDASKRADIEEKDRWLNAHRRVHGAKVHDSTSLLKKSLQRREASKSKSEQEWKNREEAVQRGIEARQRKREENLQKRRDEKGKKGKAKSKPPPKNKGKPAAAGKTNGKPTGKPAGKPVGKRRPGFEGSFRVGGRRTSN